MTGFFKIGTFFIFLISTVLAFGQDISISTTAPAHFPGGTDSLKAFLTKHFTYERNVSFCSYPLTIKAEFKVLKDGSLKQINYIGPNDNSMKFETIRTIDKMPKWFPATINGQPVVSTVTVTLYSK